MTLVVSAIEGQEIWLFCDTKISAEGGQGKAPYHALRVLSLAPDTVLAFSGAHERALEIFYQLHACGAEKLEIEELAGVIAFLRSEAGHDDVPAPEFLLARSHPEPVIFTINAQGIARSNDFTWIGNARAAAKLAEHDIFNNNALRQTMHALIADPEFDDLGGHLTIVKGNGHGFNFVPQTGKASPAFLPIEGWRSSDFGPSGPGAIGFTTITPREPGNNGFGIYFFQGRFGLFFHVDAERRINEVLKVFSATPQHFIDAVEAEVRFTLEYAADCSAG